MNADLPTRFDAGLRARSRSSIGWTVTRFLSDQIFSFVVFVILARLLAQADIGAFAVMAVTAEAFRIIATAGLVQTIARKKEITRAFLDTIYRSQQAFSFVSAILIMALAQPIAGWMDAPDIALPLAVMSLTLPISSFGATHMALRLREFGHRTTALRSVAGGLIGGTAAVVAAFAGLGLWSLVIQRLVTEIVGLVLSRASYDWKPGWQFDWAILRGNLMLNASLIYVQLAFLATVRVQEMAIGAGIGLAAVGIYRTAWRTVELIGRGAIQPFTQVAVQTLARVKDDPAELRRAYRWMISRASALSFPALVGFGALAPIAIPTVFGAKWAEAGELAQIFAFMALPFTLNFFASPSLSVLGAARSLISLSTTQLVLGVALTLAALPFGLFAVAVSYVGRAYLTLPMQIWLLRRASGIRPIDSLRAVGPPLVASSLMGVALAIAMRLLGDHFAGWQALLLLIAIGALFYGAALLAISGTWRNRLLSLSRQLRKSPI
ncbi:O-antigen/teichoic acid export membrane protein [Sphingopyxis italica]|uniref:O-antigen/teichoic acid export membrane protein n=1 Tax=Sphingopyxis italica TaxID=1129133 RepID=A0A7X6B9C8_9SPHN|nr:lipopolysaccharide biosynthesis protein [Sphingopyxis italica]NJB90695.1 O-antigen/teichoic acid export membrane protein [Sphingopyxis italica]